PARCHWAFCSWASAAGRTPMAMAMLRSTKTVRVEIRREFRGGLVCCRERHVSVGPHQIERVSTHSGARHSRLPREFMKRQTAIAAYVTNLAGRSPVDVHLPVERCERGEVISVVTVFSEPYPRQ